MKTALTKAFLKSQISIRRNLLVHNMSKNELTPIQIDCMVEKLEHIFSANSLSRFIVDNITKIRLLPPGHHHKTIQEIEVLYNEASEILELNS